MAKILRARAAKVAPDAGVSLIAHWPELGPRQGRVGAYMPVYDAIDPRPLMAALSDAGHELCLPRTTRKGLPFTFHHYTLGDPLVRGPYGMKEPKKSAPVVRPGILLVPLLAFNTVGDRLGDGHGFYDQTLAALRQGDRQDAGQDGKIFACGLAYSGQEIPLFPVERSDQRLDGVLTEAGYSAF